MAQHPGSVLVPTDQTSQQLPTVPEARAAQQTLDLSMRNSRLQRIVAAEIAVHGTENKGRILPAHEAVMKDEPTADAVRRIHLTNSIPADQRRTHTLTFRDMTSIAWINVIELTYADGSVWHAGPGRVCRVEPSPLMRIGE